MFESKQERVETGKSSIVPLNLQPSMSRGGTKKKQWPAIAVENQRQVQQRERVQGSTIKRVLLQQLKHEQLKAHEDVQCTKCSRMIDREIVKSLSADRFVRKPTVMGRMMTLQQPRSENHCMHHEHAHNMSGKKTRVRSAPSSTVAAPVPPDLLDRPPRHHRRAITQRPASAHQPRIASPPADAGNVRRRPSSAQVNSQSGCEFCPVACRPLSSSSWRPTSATGLQAVAGPAHFHYYHYNRYMRHQRPKSAIAQRQDFLSRTNRLPRHNVSPRFTSIAQACPVHEKTRSPTRQPVRQPHPGQAWADKPDDTTGLQHDVQLTQERSSPDLVLTVSFDIVADDVTEDDVIGRSGSMGEMEVRADGLRVEEYDSDEDEAETRDAQTSYTPRVAEVEIVFKTVESFTLEEVQPPIAEEDSAFRVEELSGEEDEIAGFDSDEKLEQLPVTSSIESGELHEGELLQEENPVELETDGWNIQQEPAEELPTTTSPVEEVQEVPVEEVQQQEEDQIPPVAAEAEIVEAAEISVPTTTEEPTAEEQEEKEEERVEEEEEKELPSRKNFHPSVDILSGQVCSSRDDDDVMSEDDEVAPQEMKITIRLPPPLPFSRVPEPHVESVMIVDPREDIAFDMEETDLDEDEKYVEDVGDESGKRTDGVEQENADRAKSPDPQESEDVILRTVSFSAPVILEDQDGDHHRDVEQVEEETRGGDGGNVTDHVPVVKEEVIAQVEETVITAIEQHPAVQEPVTASENAAFFIRKPSAPPKPPPVVYNYDETLTKLLADPDLDDFHPPASSAPPSAGGKSKKKKGGKKGKKKKGKKGKAPPKAPEQPPSNLCTYDPNALSAIEMALQEIASRKFDQTELQEVQNYARKFDDSCKEKLKTQPWLCGRLALSKRICRFSLPVDLRLLRGLTPGDYLSNYCVTCKRRQKLYTAAFDRQLLKRRNRDTETKESLSIKETECALKELHGGEVSNVQLQRVFELLCIDHRGAPCSVERVRCPLFVATCALTERLFYSHFVAEDAEDVNEQATRTTIECADFDNLEWKLRDIDVRSELRHLLLTFC